ncbi:MAG: Methyltransferase type 11 [Deltaproteobacteria bacterium]|nr:Methyltransferase type 11 [Deltaproteobacteria bacterium]
MKLNWAERWAVNNRSRVIQQKWEIRWFRKKSDLPAGLSLLEIGCGRGAGARIIHRTFQPRTLQASDLDLEMIRKAEDYLSLEDRRLIRFLTADILNLPYGNASFDAVFGFGVLHHVPDWQSALGEISRVLKPGGTYFLEELYPGLYQNFITKHILLHPRENRFRSRDLKMALRERNLEIRHCLEIKMAGVLGIAVKAHCQK